MPPAILLYRVDASSFTGVGGNHKCRQVVFVFETKHDTLAESADFKHSFSFSDDIGDHASNQEALDNCIRWSVIGDASLKSFNMNDDINSGIQSLYRKKGSDGSAPLFARPIPLPVRAPRNTSRAP